MSDPHNVRRANQATTRPAEPLPDSGHGRTIAGCSNSFLNKPILLREPLELPLLSDPLTTSIELPPPRLSVCPPSLDRIRPPCCAPRPPTCCARAWCAARPPWPPELRRLTPSPTRPSPTSRSDGRACLSRSRPTSGWLCVTACRSTGRS